MRKLISRVRVYGMKHAHAAVAHPEHYVIAMTITGALLLVKHFDVAAVWVLWLDKIMTSVFEG